MTTMTTPQRRLLSGRCQCGAVKYVVTDAFDYAANCHCSDCRRATGSVFKPFAGIEREELTVTEGRDRLLIVGDRMNHDARCRMCGSLLYSLVRDGQFVHVAMGSLTDSPSIRPTAHIFVGSKASWYTINDDLPQYERHASDGPPISR